MERKKTMEKRKKKQEESDVNDDPFARFPLDLRIEILMKLPARSIAKLEFVSKVWAPIIRGKEFTDLYMTQPRLLFRVHRQGLHLFHSSSQENPSYDHHDRVSITLDPSLYYVFSPPTHGLICGRKDSKVLIGNPSTGQFITLPRARTRRVGIYSFFGYEPANHVYKVLSMRSIKFSL
ncbi:hypothetical protein AALP_AA5G119800 [Arabis alpina]|uniref:Uncharacterized protein n=1 Tax=Arabis alpina TaxID=50452 RepID=A0A087GWJ1_ARAAL|nr:hypothetical protein AALP_AA5G119800 [Arabis alpina]